jgi:hypothetical protein
MPAYDVMNGFADVGLLVYVVVFAVMMWIGFFIGRNK